MLKVLKIVKFKTFENVTIPFHKNLSVICGPHGAGKTILIESLLFSLGEPAFDRTDNFAETEILIENTLFKRIEKNQNSSYFIDGKKVARKAYLDKLKKFGLECNDKNMYVEGFFDLITKDNQRRTLNDKINLSYSFYIYDDFDSRLDRKHTEKFFKILKNKNKQFIVVTHDDQIIAHADRIYGIIMQTKKSEIIELEA